MKEVLMYNLKEYKERLEGLQYEKKELTKEVNDYVKLEKMAKEIENHGGVIELPNIDEKKLSLRECELNIKICKSIIRRYESVCDFYFGEKETTQEMEQEEIQE